MTVSPASFPPLPNADLLDRFTDIPVPGKRPPVNRPVDEPAPLWDTKPITFKVKGKDREFYTISALALALGRAPVTLRSWEDKGLLPSSRYRAPKPRRETVPGVAPKGKRLWTREQIEGILVIAKQEKVILNGKAPSPRFAQRVSQYFNQLLEQDQL
jgi:hypothetical protein